VLDDYNSNVNPTHPLKGNDAFLVVENIGYVAPSSQSLHPSPLIEQQSVKFQISPEKRNEIIVSGAKNSPYDGIVQLFIDIDGQMAISINEARSDWNKWIHILYSFGTKCDNASHLVNILVKQYVCEIMGMGGRFQEIFRETRTLKFEKPLTRKKEGTLQDKIKRAIMKGSRSQQNDT